MTDAAGSDQRPEWLRLYDEAYERFGVRALWSYRKALEPTPGQALAICYSLRTQGNLYARKLADRLERACHAA